MNLRLILILYFALYSSAFAQKQAFDISIVPFCSDELDEFSPVYYGKGLVFCSDLNTSKIVRYSDDESGGLYKIAYADTSGTDVRLFSGSITSNLNDGPVTFSPSGDTIYFSRNLVIKGTPSQISAKRNKLGIFYAVRSGNTWTGIKELRFNSDSYNITSPCLSPDGKQLYFASDRPDGYGGSDIFMCDWKNGYWSNPENLGPVINTKGNEAYPFAGPEGELYFSSDSLPGLGGKDIFFSKYADSAWITPVRLESPVNSTANDFGFLSDQYASQGYFSSDRGGSLDIYSFRAARPQLLYCPEQKKNRYCFSFPDDMSIDVDPVNLQFQWEFGDQKASGYVVTHCFPGPGRYPVRQRIIDRKTGKTVHTKLSVDLELKSFDEPFINSPDMTSVASQVVFDADLNDIEASKIRYFWDFGQARMEGKSVTNSFSDTGNYIIKVGLSYTKDGKLVQKCSSKRITVISDLADTVNIILDTLKDEINTIADSRFIEGDTLYSSAAVIAKDAVWQVKILRSGTRISTGDNRFADVKTKYNLREIADNSGEYSYVIDEKALFMDAYFAYTDAVSMGFPDTYIDTYIPSGRAESGLWQIKKSNDLSADAFFGAGDSRLSSDRVTVLDQIAELMQTDPEALLKIEVHTDNAGQPAANLKLSETRARSIASYLGGRGISQKRILAQGYGGSRPVASNYSEAGRRKNRRIDFILLYE